MNFKTYIIGLSAIVLLSTSTTPEVSARMVFFSDEGATNADVFVIDADDSNTSEIQVQFWQTLSRTLKWDNLNGSFTFNDALTVSGSLAINGALDFNQNEALEMRFENLNSAPLSPLAGQVYHNTTDNISYVWDGSSWINIMQTGSGTGAEITGTTSNSFVIDSDNNGNPQILSFGSTLTKTLAFDTTNDWFNLSDRLNIGGDGTLSGIKLTTRASAIDAEQNQIEIRNNANASVFSVDEDGDILANSITTTATQTKYKSLALNGGINISVTLGTIANYKSPVIRCDKNGDSSMSHSLPVPDDWIPGTNIIVETFWTQSDNTTGNIEWDFDYASFDANELVEDAAFTNISYTQAVPGVDVQLMSTNTNFTIPAISISNDEMLNFRIKRAGADIKDTYNSDINIQMIRLSYTGKKIL